MSNLNFFSLKLKCETLRWFECICEFCELSEKMSIRICNGQPSSVSDEERQAEQALRRLLRMPSREMPKAKNQCQKGVRNIIGQCQAECIKATRNTCCSDEFVDLLIKKAFEKARNKFMKPKLVSTRPFTSKAVKKQQILAAKRRAALANMVERAKKQNTGV